MGWLVLRFASSIQSNLAAGRVGRPTKFGGTYGGKNARFLADLAASVGGFTLGSELSGADDEQGDNLHLSITAKKLEIRLQPA